jgi:hypothetical protein
MRLSFCFPTSDSIREGVRRLAGVIRDQVALREAFYGRQTPTKDDVT